MDVTCQNKLRPNLVLALEAQDAFENYMEGVSQETAGCQNKFYRIKFFQLKFLWNMVQLNRIMRFSLIEI
jgi:hypothetical protein